MGAEAIGPLVQVLIPIVTPVILKLAHNFFTWLGTKLPDWVLPLASPIVGAALAAATGQAGLETGAVLGLAGVGVREVVNQTVTGAKLPAPKSTPPGNGMLKG